MSCDAIALAQPTAVAALASGATRLVTPACSGKSGWTFSALVSNPQNSYLYVYLGVGTAQCGARCVATSLRAA